MDNGTMKQWNRKGFTLVEILVAVSIVILLATVGMVSYSAAGRSGRDAKRKADLEQARSALEIFKSDYGGYPNDWAGSPPNYVTGSGLTCGGTTYVGVLTDPKPINGYVYYSQTTTSVTLSSNCPGNAGRRGYFLCAYLESPPSGYTPPPACTTRSCGPVLCNYGVTNP